jgi:hypothetical protein
VVRLERFEANVVTFQNGTLPSHSIHYAMSGGVAATT